ncbi:MAG: dienelactone hydrolase family protein [Methylocystis sp.]
MSQFAAQSVAPIDAIDSRVGDMPVYAAKPADSVQPPILIVVAEIFGLNDHIRDVVRRFAAEGYLSIAPDFFFRVGDPSQEQDIAAIRAIVMKVPDAQAMQDFDAALAFASTLGGDGTRAAITGFCWGGRMAWLYAAHNPKLRAVVPWYGRLDGDRTENRPQWPIDVAERLAVPALGLYGGDDPSIPLELVEKMRERLGAAPAPGEIVVYPNAPHAFFADYRESYRKEAAQDAFARMLDFLRAQGAA